MSHFCCKTIVAIAFLSLISCEGSVTEENRVANEITIEEYLESNKIDFVKYDGVYASILSKGFGYFPAPGDSVAFWYVGRTLKNEVFDTNIIEVAQEIGIEPSSREFNPVKIVVESDNLIEGLSRGIKLCREGQWTSIHFPSTLGYGDIHTGPVEPWTPLVFDVFIIYVKNDKITQEQNNINNFVAGMQGFTPDTTGIWYKFTSEGTGVVSPMPNDTIYGWYNITTFDYETILEVETENREIVMDNQLIEGLLLGFMKLKPGDAMQMVIPSPLAFGYKQTSEVEPYTPLYCEIRLDSIK